MPTERLEFRGKPILRIIDLNNPNIKAQFGLSKARIILANIKEIEQFVVDCELEALKKNSREETGCGEGVQSEDQAAGIE